MLKIDPCKVLFLVSQALLLPMRGQNFIFAIRCWEKICGIYFCDRAIMIYFAEFNFAIDRVMLNFAEFNFAKWGQNRKNKFRKNFFRKNLSPQKFLSLR